MKGVNRIRRILRRMRGSRGRQPLRFVFVVTYGRSGSTLVQGLLNVLPGTVVRGENGLFALQLYRAMTTALAFRTQHAKHAPRQVSSAFYGVHELRRSRFVGNARALVTRILLGDMERHDVRVLGFKEVLWHEVTPEETEGFFEWMDQVFPGARYVLNTRDHSSVVTSGFWRRHDTDEALAAVQRVEEIQAHLRATRPDRVHDTVYEQITGDDRAEADAQLRDLARFVTGSCDDALLADLRATLDTAHGPHAFGTSRAGRGGSGPTSEPHREAGGEEPPPG